MKETDLASDMNYLKQASRSIRLNLETQNEKLTRVKDLHPDVLRAKHIAKQWCASREGRKATMYADSVPSMNLRLYMAPEDDIPQVYLFMEEHAPQLYDVSSSGGAPFFHSRNLWVAFDPDNSAHCSWVDKRTSVETTERKLVCVD